MNNQLYIFAIFIFNGLLIGLLFDIFRITRKIFKVPDFITYIEDILFWILTGLLLLYSIFKFNNGELRAFIFIGATIGVSFYIVIFSKIFIKVNMFIINVFKKIINYIFLIPINFILKIFKKIIFKPISFCIINIRKSFKKIILKVKRNIKKEFFDKKRI